MQTNILLPHISKDFSFWGLGESMPRICTFLQISNFLFSKQLKKAKEPCSWWPVKVRRQSIRQHKFELSLNWLLLTWMLKYCIQAHQCTEDFNSNSFPGCQIFCLVPLLLAITKQHFKSYEFHIKVLAKSSRLCNFVSMFHFRSKKKTLINMVLWCTY